MTTVDFGRHSDDYAQFRPGFPPSFYDRLDAILPLSGVRALDLATGPGVVALELAARGARVTGLDISQEQIDAARRSAEKRALDPADFFVGDAHDTGLEDASFDWITAGQCWHWFDHARAMAEARRLLRPGGMLAIAHYCYLAEHCPIARDTEALILQHNPSWTMAGWKGVFPELIDGVIEEDCELAEQFCYHHGEEFSHDRWRGRIRTCNGVGSGGLPPDEVPRFDEDLARLLQEKYPDPMIVDHRVWCVVARKPLSEDDNAGD